MSYLCHWRRLKSACASSRILRFGISILFCKTMASRRLVRYFELLQKKATFFHLIIRDLRRSLISPSMFPRREHFQLFLTLSAEPFRTRSRWRARSARFAATPFTKTSFLKKKLFAVHQESTSTEPVLFGFYEKMRGFNEELR